MLNRNDYYHLLHEAEGLSLTERLDLLLNYTNTTKKQFSDESGIPYPTIMGFYQKGMESIKLSTLQKICAYFNISEYYFMAADYHEWGDDLFLNGLFDYLSVDDKARSIVSAYRSLPEAHQNAFHVLIHTVAADYTTYIYQEEDQEGS